MSTPFDPTPDPQRPPSEVPPTGAPVPPSAPTQPGAQPAQQAAPYGQAPAQPTQYPQAPAQPAQYPQAPAQPAQYPQAPAQPPAQPQYGQAPAQPAQYPQASAQPPAQPQYGQAPAQPAQYPQAPAQPPAQPQYGQAPAQPSAYQQAPAAQPVAPAMAYAAAPSPYGQGAPGQPPADLGGFGGLGGPTGPGGPAAPQPPAKNPGAVLGWVGAGLALLVGFIGMVLGAMSISRSRKAGASTTPGVVAAVVGTLQVLTVIVVVLVLVIRALSGDAMRDNAGDVDSARDVAIVDVVPGACLDLNSVTDASVTQVPCADGHNGEVIAQLEPSGSAYPGDDTLWAQAESECLDPVVRSLPPTVDPTSLYLDAFVPTLEEWEAGDRLISCLLGSYETTMTGSATAGDLRVS